MFTSFQGIGQENVVFVNGEAYVSLITSTSGAMCGVPGLPLNTPYLFMGNSFFVSIHVEIRVRDLNLVCQF